MAEWRFPSNDYGEKKGINDSGIASFRGTPLRSLAREICQNSLDAAREDTVHIDFNAFSIPTDQLPGYMVLKDTFQKCADFWKNQKAITTKTFFENAINKISAEEIYMLRISDFNTCGLTGSKEEINTNWTDLTKSSGVSDKKGDAGGSFGIGKFAPFACSDFSTVFYSTYDEEDVEASQGVSRLVTFRRDDGETTQGVGYYGEEKNTPTFSQLQLDPNFSRKEKEYGADIYIAGYKHISEDGGWEKSIIISILDGFLGALWNNKLVVTVGDIEVSKETLDDLVETYRDELTGHTGYYYEVLKSDNTVWHEEDVMGLGPVRLGLLLGEQDMPRRVAMIRSIGMKIKEQDRISSFIPFAGIMFIEGDKLNRELRKLENPEHIDWQVGRADDEIKAKALLRALRNIILDQIENLAASNNQNSFDVPGLGAILPDDLDESRNEAAEETVNDSPIEIVKTIPSKSVAQTAGANTGGIEDVDIFEGGYQEGDSVLGYLDGQGKKKKKGTQPPYPVDPNLDGSEKNQSQSQVVFPKKVRVICRDKSTGEYVVVFIPEADGIDGEISFSLSAETKRYPAPIKAASIIGTGDIQISENKLTGFEFKKDVPIRINLQLDYSDFCSMEVSASANQK